MVTIIRLDDLELSNEFKAKLRTRKNKLQIDDSLIYNEEPSCIKDNCICYGRKPICYVEWFKECDKFEGEKEK